MPNILKRLITNRLLLAKISFSVYNLGIIIILNLFVDSRIAGNILYIQGVIYLASSVSRLGSDYYWVSDGSSNMISIYKYELPSLLLTGFLSACILKIFINGFDSYSIFLITISIYLLNFLAFMARLYQKNNMHIKSLFLQLIAPMLLVVPIFLLLRVNALIAISLSLFSVTILILVIFKNPRYSFKYSRKNFFERIHYLPMIIYGVINQNFISIVSGALGKEHIAPLLVLYQKVSGFITWPQIFFMQKKMRSILLSVKTLHRFKAYLSAYLKINLPLISLYALGVMVFMSWYLFNNNILTVDSFLSLIIIIMATIINASLAHLQLIIGKEKKSRGTFFALFLILPFMIFIGNYMNVNTIVISLFYFFYQLSIHLLSLSLIYNHIKTNTKYG